MFVYQDRKYYVEELKAIFAKSTSRNDFISGYEYWGEDDNTDFYRIFIDEGITDSNKKTQEDAIELSMRTKIFARAYLSTIREIIYSNRHFWIKLVCLDWLSVFRNEIPADEFIEINKYALEMARSELNLIQAIFEFDAK